MELNPFSWEFHEDPHPTYRWLRDHAPIYRNDVMDFWAISRFQDVMGAFLDWQTYSSVGGLILEKLDPAHLELTPMMIFMDPPRHDRLRKLVSRVFTPRRVAALEPFVRTLARKLLEPLAAEGGGDFVEDFSTPLPMDVIFTLLGVPGSDRRQLREWIDVSLSRDAGTDAVPARAIEAGLNSLRYWFQLVQHLRAHPNDGLICDLFDTEIEDNGSGMTRLTDGEIIGFCSLLGAAGSETTTRLLGFAAVLFSRHPDQFASIVADRDRIPGAVEEVLRWASPAPGMRSHRESRRRVVRPDRARGVQDPAPGGRGQPRRAGVPGPRPLRHHARYPDPARTRAGGALLPGGIAGAPGGPGCAGGIRAHLPAFRGRRGGLRARPHEQRPRLRARAVPPHLSRKIAAIGVDWSPIGITSRPAMSNATSRRGTSARCPPRAAD